MSACGGWAHHAVDPKAPGQVDVTDIDNARVNAEGLVEFSAEFYIVRPVDPTKGNNRLFYDYGNRGNIRAFQFFNDAPHSNDPLSLKEAGNGYLMKRGYCFMECMARRLVAGR